MEKYLNIVANIGFKDNDVRKILYFDILNLDTIDKDLIIEIIEKLSILFDKKEIGIDNILDLEKTYDSDGNIEVISLGNDEDPELNEMISESFKFKKMCLDKIDNINYFSENIVKCKFKKVNIIIMINDESEDVYTGIYDSRTEEQLANEFTYLDMSILVTLLENIINYNENLVCSMNYMFSAPNNSIYIYNIWFKSIYDLFLISYNQKEDGYDAVEDLILELKKCLYNHFILLDNYIINTYTLINNDQDKQFCELEDTRIVPRKFMEPRLN